MTGEGIATADSSVGSRWYQNIACHIGWRVAIYLCGEEHSRPCIGVLLDGDDSAIALETTAGLTMIPKNAIRKMVFLEECKL